MAALLIPRAVVCFALPREARAFRPPAGVVVRVVGPGPAAAVELRKLLGAMSPALVVSAGFAGGLVPGLRVGEVVVPGRVTDGVNSWPCGGGGRSTLVTTTHVVATPAEKATLAERTGAVAVDMEAAHLAAVCAAAGVAFAAVKAISDTSDTALSPALVRLFGAGGVTPLRAAFAAVRRPALVREFLRLGRDSAAAAEALAAELHARLGAATAVASLAR